MPQTVLIVDDDAVLGPLLGRGLEARGYSSVVLQDPEAALDAASASPWQIALVDVDLAGDSGWAVLDSLRRIAPDRLIVMMSGGFTGDQATDLDGLACERVALLAKPFTLVELLAAMSPELQDAAA